MHHNFDIIATVKLIRFVLVTGVVISLNTSVHADDTSRITQLTQLYNTTGMVCGGISNELQHLKNMTTGNAVVSGVGTVAAGGALYAGLSKAQIDKEIEELQRQICDAGGCTEEGVAAMSDDDFMTTVMEPFIRILELRQQLDDAKDKSVRLGNWRTGLMAGATATNITSAILSGVNRNQSDLIQQITACNNAIAVAKNADVSGLNPTEYPIVNKMDAIKTWCPEIDTAEIEKFEKQQTVVMGTSIAGAVTGTTGTVTSAIANSDDVRGKHDAKEKNLNTTANVMAGATTVLSGVSTGFNIASINKINKIIKQVKLCEDIF